MHAVVHWNTEPVHEFPLMQAWPASWGGRTLAGQLDEVRVSTSVHTAAWIQTEYNNQHSGSTFIKSIAAGEIVTTP